MKRLGLITALALVSTLAVIAQSRQPILRMAPFVGTGVGSSEASMLERLVSSYIVELKVFRVIDDKGQVLALSETEAALGLGAETSVSAPLAADYIVTGTLGKIGDLYVFTLDNTKVSTGEKLTVSDTAPAINDIVLRARALTCSLFGKAEAVTASLDTDPATATSRVWENPAIGDIVGTWRGDKGLETVRVFPNATGIAVLSGGGTLKVRVSFTGNDIIIVQDQPNDVILYRAASVTLEMARKIAAQARPMRWLFTLSPDGKTLGGTKESLTVQGSGDALRVDNSYVRDASWVRISR